MNTTICSIISFCTTLCLVFATTLPAIGQGNTASYSYDALGRLVKVTFANGTTIKYFYDGAGNRTSTEVCCSDPAKLTTGDLMSDWLVSGMVAPQPVVLDPRSDSDLMLPSSIALSNDENLLWISTSKDLGSAQTAYNVLALDLQDQFSIEESCSSGTSTLAEGVSTLVIPDSNVVLNAIKTSSGSGHGFIASTPTTCGTPVSLAAANVFAALSADGTTAAFVLANGTVALSNNWDDFASVSDTFSISADPLSIAFASDGASVWISYEASSVIEQRDLDGVVLRTFDLQSATPDYRFMQMAGASLVISSDSDHKIFAVDVSGIPAISTTLDLGTVAPGEVVIRGQTGYASGPETSLGNHKIIRFQLGASTFVSLDTGVHDPIAGLAVNSDQTHAYLVSGGAPAVTHDIALPASVIPAGVAYVDGQRVIAAETPHQFNPDKDTYQFLQSDGTSVFIEVDNNDPAPSHSGLLISKTITGAGGITAITQLAPEIATITGYARSGANSDITSLDGLTTPLSIVEGGTGANTASNARANLQAAASGANGDITSLSGLTTPLSIAQGGTGANSASAARANIGAGASGANSDIASLSGLTTPLSISQGGTGSSEGVFAQLFGWETELSTSGTVTLTNANKTYQIGDGPVTYVLPQASTVGKKFFCITNATAPSANQVVTVKQQGSDFIKASNNGQIVLVPGDSIILFPYQQSGAYWWQVLSHRERQESIVTGLTSYTAGTVPYVFTIAAAPTITLPIGHGYGFKTYWIKHRGTGNATIDATTGGGIMQMNGTLAQTMTLGPQEAILLYCVSSTNWRVLSHSIPTLPVSKGGSGSTTASGARANLSAAVSGANSDITSIAGLTTPLSAAQGGTGANHMVFGTVTLSSGTATITDASTTTSTICLVSQADNASPILETFKAVPASGSVTITSSNSASTANVSYLFLN